MHTERRTPWMAVVALPQPETRRPFGDGREIILQGFHWDSHIGVCEPGKHRRSWYQILKENAPSIRTAGFTWVWFPQPSDSLAPQGYIPRRWHHLDTAFGSAADLHAAISALEPVKAMADVVLNHRVGVATGGADFEDPPFPDNRAAIVRDDESGAGTGNHDTGERHPAGRDLDHTNGDVRNVIKTYLRGLRNLGFKGWRYDLAKGFAGRFIGEYNEASGPEFSVGEFFDTDRQKVTDWIDSTGGRSTAFDFPTRYLLHEATLRDDYRRMRTEGGGRSIPGGLIGYWPSHAVTFVDNHDTEYRREAEHQANHDSTRHFHGATVSMAYAYTLTHPGTPCVFWSHFFDWGHGVRRKISQLMQIRKLTGLHAASPVEIKDATRGLYAAVIDGKVAMKLGTRDWSPGHGWHLAVDGDRFAVWTRDVA